MKIKEVVKRYGFTLEQVASLMVNSKTGNQGITKQAMSLIVNGNPTTETLRQIANIIGCDVVEFFKDECRNNYDNVIKCPHCGKEIEFKPK